MNVTTAQRKFGFSLIELLVVVSIFGLLFLPLLITYRSAIRNQALRVSAQSFADNLRLVHVYSRGSREEAAWGVTRVDTSSYAIVKGSPSEYEEKTRFQLESGVFFEGEFGIWFEEGTGDALEEKSVVLESESGRKMEVVVYKGGSVEAYPYE